MSLICPTCKMMRDNWKREKMEALIQEARDKAAEAGKPVAIIKESALDYHIVGIDEIKGKNLIKIVTSG